MKLKKLMCAILPAVILSACSGDNTAVFTESAEDGTTVLSTELSNKIVQLESGLTAVKYNDDYKVAEFLEGGGADTDMGVIKYISENLLSGADYLGFIGKNFGCSTISAESSDGGYLFGRNFDWDKCNAMIVQTDPPDGYASISTVNTDFISMSGMSVSKMPDNILALAGIYAPLDGMNEKGLCVSVNMISDSENTNQDTDKPDITTTTAVRLLLDNASNTDEAISLLEQYDFHTSMGMTVHFAIADNSGKSVCVEYLNGEMIVTETPVVTNFYFSEGEKNGIGTQQSHERYDILTTLLSENTALDMNGMRDALDSVSKDNFNEFESTEWSIVFDPQMGEVRYFHREDYAKCYKFNLETEAGT